MPAPPCPRWRRRRRRLGGPETTRHPAILVFDHARPSSWAPARFAPRHRACNEFIRQPPGVSLSCRAQVRALLTMHSIDAAEGSERRSRPDVRTHPRAPIERRIRSGDFPYQCPLIGSPSCGRRCPPWRSRPLSLCTRTVGMRHKPDPPNGRRMSVHGILRRITAGPSAASRNSHEIRASTARRIDARQVPGNRGLCLPSQVTQPAVACR